MGERIRTVGHSPPRKRRADVVARGGVHFAKLDRVMLTTGTLVNTGDAFRLFEIVTVVLDAHARMTAGLELELGRHLQYSRVREWRPRIFALRRASNSLKVSGFPFTEIRVAGGIAFAHMPSACALPSSKVA